MKVITYALFGKKKYIAKQSVFLRIQVRASGQTKGLERG